MSIREHLQAIAESLSIPAPSFSYTDNPQFNVIAPNTDFSKPHIRLREIEEGGISVVGMGGHRDDFVIFLQFLKKGDAENTTVQHDVIIEQMRGLVSSFINKYNNYRVGGTQVFEEVERVKLVSLTNEYAEGLTGLEAQFTAKLMKPRAVCS